MYRFALFTIFALFLCACQNEQNVEKEFPKTEKGDRIIHITTINSAKDTLFQIRNATKGTSIIYYKGDSIFLLQDDVGFSNKNYVLTEQNGTTTLMQNGEIIFRNPVK